MKVGGNAAFADFLARHPGSFSASSGNVKDRYTCSAALKYRDELAKRSAADLAQFGPGRIVTSDLTGVSGAEAPVANGNGPAAGGDGADADFFDSWNKPAAAPKPRSTGAASPLIALSPSGSRAGSRAASPAPSPATAPAPAVAAAPAQPRTTTSASLRATAGTKVAGPSLGTSATRPMKLGASRIGSGAGAAGGGLGARSKLGAAKASAPIDFDAAERKAREEEERIKQLGYDSRREAEEAAAKAQANAQTSAANAAAAAAARKAANAEVEKAALGVQRLGFGQVTGMSGAESAAKVEAARKAAARAAAGYDNTGAWRQNATQLTGQTRRARRLRATSSASRRASRRISTLAATPTTRTRRAKLSLVFSSSPARPPSLPIRCVTHQCG